MICIDTNVLIWGVQGVARPAQQGMVDRTRRYLAQLARDSEQLMVPSVAVVGEYLQGFPPDEQPAQLEVLSGVFFVAAYDARCAALGGAAAASRAGSPGRARSARSRFQWPTFRSLRRQSVTAPARS